MQNTRDAFFDNAKYLLIFLVVFGHIISPIKNESNTLFALYKFIYLFHMPAFILIAGYFAKGIHQKGHLRKMLKKTVVPYLFFQLIYTFFYFYTGYESELTFSLFSPHWTLWFLLSLFFWHVLLRMFVKFPIPLVLSFIVGIGAGYVSTFGSFLSIERTLVFFPFFLLGYKLERRHFSFIKKKTMMMVSSLVLLSIFVFCYTAMPDSAKVWLWSSASYSSMGVGGIEAGSTRLMFYGLMLLSTFSFLSMVPRIKTHFTPLGTYTLYIYLLHGFIIKIAELGSISWDIHPIAFFVLIILAAYIICSILASKPVRNLFKPLIEIRLPHRSRKVSISN